MFGIVNASASHYSSSSYICITDLTASASKSDDCLLTVEFLYIILTLSFMGYPSSLGRWFWLALPRNITDSSGHSTPWSLGRRFWFALPRNIDDAVVADLVGLI
ncbi:hypothetical protein RND81_11G041800 [Saponaria officinalis]|uniref:Uncharacterized protein n=1 Tax=Saponaria officinalis TaxID=3572 RepID=A0AAW1HHQ3_SAPOF